MCQVMADDPGGTGAHVAAPAFQTRAVLYSGKRLAGSDEPEDESLLMGGFDGHVNCCEKEKKRVPWNPAGVGSLFAVGLL